MKNIIKTDNYLLIVSDEEIKEGEYFYSIRNLIEKAIFTYSKSEHIGKIIAHLPLNNSPILEGVDLLPPLEDDEVDTLLKIEQEEAYKNGKGTISWYELDKRKEYYNKAKEKYKYTEEDLRKAIDMAREQYLVKYTDNDYDFEYKEDEIIQSLQQPKYPIGFEYKEDEIIQSLQQPKYPIGFECEMVTRVFDVYPQTINHIPKTTANSQGQTVLEGKYIYE